TNARAESGNGLRSNHASRTGQRGRDHRSWPAPPRRRGAVTALCPPNAAPGPIRSAARTQQLVARPTRGVLVNPDDRGYSKEHEWGKVDGDLVIVGITDYAQDQLGDVVYVELPKMGDRVQQFEIFGVIESVKTASDLYAPLGGTVVAVNDSLTDDPAQVNDSP